MLSEPCILDVEWLQLQTTAPGSDLRAEHTICYMKTLKVDHSADQIPPKLVPGAAFFCGFMFGWGLIWALQAVISPKKKSSRVLGGCRVD